jgi:hypothetical protein
LFWIIYDDNVICAPFVFIKTALFLKNVSPVKDKNAPKALFFSTLSLCRRLLIHHPQTSPQQRRVINISFYRRTLKVKSKDRKTILEADKSSFG